MKRLWNEKNNLKFFYFFNLSKLLHKKIPYSPLAIRYYFYFKSFPEIHASTFLPSLKLVTVP